MVDSNNKSHSSNNGSKHNKSFPPLLGSRDNTGLAESDYLLARSKIDWFIAGLCTGIIVAALSIFIIILAGIKIN